MNFSYSIEHNGVTYKGEPAKIDSTMLGTEDHGILSAMLYTSWKGGGVGVGGYALDTPEKDANGKFLGRIGTAYGMDQIKRIMDTVGVRKWEDLPGKQIVVLFGEGGGWGSTAKGFANPLTHEIFIMEEHAAEWRLRDGETADA